MSINRLFKKMTIVIGLITTILPTTSFSQILIGFNSGINLSGAQDHKFKQYNNNKELINYFKTKDIDGILSYLNNLHITVWHVKHTHPDIGIRFDCLSWNLTTMVDEFPKNISPPFNKIEQERISLTVSILRRIPLSSIANWFSDHNQTYLYGGLGAGLVHSDVEHGLRKWGRGIQLLGGISFPMRQNLFLQIECRYFLAPDVDTIPKTGWQIDTSGTHTFLRFDPHLDTSFLGVLVGIDCHF